METIELSHSATELSTFEVSFVLIKDGNKKAVLSLPQTQFFQAVDAEDATAQLYDFYGKRNVTWLGTGEVMSPIATPEERQEVMLANLAASLADAGITLRQFVSSARILQLI